MRVLLFDCADVHGIDAFIVGLSYLKGIADFIVSESEGAAVCGIRRCC